jgi:uncharacterized protein (DUF58 family)
MERSRLVAGSVAIAAIAGAVIVGAVIAEVGIGQAPPASSDAALARALEQAAASRVAPADAERVIGRAATFSTVRSADQRRLLPSLTITTEDRGAGTAIDVASAVDAIYWARAASGHDFPIAGLLWRRGGRVEAFSGWLLPP